MKLRKERGGTLALVAAATITLILLGICFFFLAQIFGGEREIQHATDSGSLNVAKNALRKPSIPLNPGIEQELYGQLGDRTLINNAQPPTCPPVNLLTYNRLYAQALLVSLNAQADPGPGQLAVDHAREMVNTLQSGPTSIGGRLSRDLSATSGNPLLGNFSETADQNSLRMLGANSILNRVDNDFAVSFLEQTSNDIGATNVEIPSSLSGLFNASLQSSMFTTKGGKQYLRGYISPSIVSGAGTPVGVPLQPGDQPHLVSNKTFAEQISRGNAFSSAMVPPNGFRSRSQAQEERSANNASTIACAEVGSLNLTFPLAMPYGYIKIQNGPDSGSGAANVSGPFAGLDHVLNNELLNPGIFVAGPVFSDNLNLEQKWAAYNKAQAEGANPMPPQPSLDGLYNHQGQPATLNDAKGIPYDSDGNLVMTQCTDDNSTGWSRNDPDVVPKCWDLLGNGSGPGAFDTAFHPNAQYQDSTTGSASDLMSVECAKCQLQHKFNSCGDLSVSSANCAVTGLRTFNKNAGNIPSSSMGQCKISQIGTVAGLGNFVQSGFGTQIENLVAQRARQINPTNGEAQARQLLQTKTLNLGEVAYIYALAPDNGQPNLVWSNIAPPWANSGTQPDGTSLPATDSYNIVYGGGGAGLVNSKNDGGIHDIMYREHPSSGIQGTDTATWTPSSGYKNLLGKVQFTNAAAGTASGFCKPD